MLGSIPKLSMNNSLREVFLSNNLLSRDIPKDFLQNPNIEILDLAQNKLSGYLWENNTRLPIKPGSSIQLQVILVF